MRTFSLKGLAAGILAALVLSMPLSLLFGYYVVAIYNDLSTSAHSLNEIEAQELFSQFLSHPLAIAYVMIATLIGVGIPAYISACVAGRSFALHSLALGGILSLSCLLEWETLSQFPVAIAILVGLSLVVAYSAGELRKRQVARAA